MFFSPHFYTISLVILFYCFPTWAQAEVENKSIKNTNATHKTTSIKYELSMLLQSSKNGKKTKDENKLTTLLWQVSNAKRLIDKEVNSRLMVKSRANSDLPVFIKALNSRGYYEAKASYQMDSSSHPIKINYRITLGPRYKIGDIQLKPISSESGSDKKSTYLANLIHWKDNNASLLSLKSRLKKHAADARKIILFEDKVIFLLKKSSYADSELVSKKYLLNRSTKTLSLIYGINFGQEVLLGDVIFKGLTSINTSYLNDIISLKKGIRYSPEILDNTFSKLLETNLFAKVKVTLAPSNHSSKNSSDPQLRQVNIELRERKHRTIKTSIGFDTDKGVILGGEWEHRNFFGSGEKLKLETQWYDDGFSFESMYSYHDTIFNYPLEFISQLNINDEETDAYTSRTFMISQGVNYDIDESMQIGAGIGYRSSEVVTLELDQYDIKEDNYSLLYFPLRFKFNNSNDPFEPSAGSKFLLQVAPYQSTVSNVHFTRVSSSLSFYHSIFKDKPNSDFNLDSDDEVTKNRVVLALRAKFAQILECDKADVPADLRYYAGGGGSIRGYASQLVGPLSSTNTPLGGCAVADFSVEARVKTSPNIGIVLFVDGGTAFSETLFDPSSDVALGVGVGFRYSSPIGPLRIDLASPVSPRKDIDASYQLYISIGHAF